MDKNNKIKPMNNLIMKGEFMGILLGNLTVQEMEKRLGIILTDDERQFLISTRQPKADKIEKDKWHCFDIPFDLVCGSMEFATKVYEVLKPYSDQMIEQLQVSIES